MTHIICGCDEERRVRTMRGQETHQISQRQQRALVDEAVRAYCRENGLDPNDPREYVIGLRKARGRSKLLRELEAGS